MQPTITIPNTAIEDTATTAVAYAGLSGTTYQIVTIDTTAPQVTTYSPSQGATDQAVDTNIVLTFDEHVAPGSGNVVLTPAANSHTAVSPGSAVSIAIGDTSQITFSNSGGTGTVTINPSSELVTIGATYHHNPQHSH